MLYLFLEVFIIFANNGFYAWLHATPTVQDRAEAEAELRGDIGRIFAAQRRVYGLPRIHAELRREGRQHARRRVERLMRAAHTATAGPVRTAGPPAGIPDHRQPPRPPGRPQHLLVAGWAGVSGVGLRCAASHV